jgi:uncharacterized protein YebE (UPF0316 family)
MMELVLGLLMVFCLRIMDVSMGTVRQILAIQGRAVLAAGIGFVEVTIFLIAISKVILSARDNVWLTLAYSAGFAVGTLLGVRIESRLALGRRLIRVITVRQNDDLVHALRDAGFGVTCVPGEGMNGPVYVLFSVVKRRLVKDYLRIVQKYAPKAFFTVEETRFVSGGVVGMRKHK